MKKLILVLLIGLSSISCKTDKEEEKKYKYTVWVGSASFAVGYNSNNYWRDGDMFYYVDDEQDTTSIPFHSLYKVEKNGE